jgi:NH3-dependent NAD+ synthetase
MKFLIFVVLTSSLFSQEIKPNQEIYANNVTTELINDHLQQNYNMPLYKKIGLILTGIVVKDNNKNIDNRAYTNFKIEF